MTKYIVISQSLVELYFYTLYKNCIKIIEKDSVKYKKKDNVKNVSKLDFGIKREITKLLPTCF